MQGTFHKAGSFCTNGDVPAGLGLIGAHEMSISRLCGQFIGFPAGFLGRAPHFPFRERTSAVASLRASIATAVPGQTTASCHSREIRKPSVPRRFRTLPAWVDQKERHPDARGDVRPTRWIRARRRACGRGRGAKSTGGSSGAPVVSAAPRQSGTEILCRSSGRFSALF
jgi:hypothetical protein